MHINFSAKSSGRDVIPHIISGILDRICEMTLFLNTSDASYRRFGNNKAPDYVTWSPENRSRLVRIPAPTAEDTGRQAFAGRCATRISPSAYDTREP